MLACGNYAAGALLKGLRAARFKRTAVPYYLPAGRAQTRNLSAFLFRL